MSKKNLKPVFDWPLWIIFGALTCIGVFIFSKDSKSDEWLIDDYIAWGHENQIEKNHEVHLIQKDGEFEVRENGSNLNQVSFTDIAEDLKYFYPRVQYWYVLEFSGKYEDLPNPIKNVLDKFKPEHKGKRIGEIIPEAEKILAICAKDNEGNIVSKEAISVYIEDVSHNKMSITLRTGDFPVGDDPEVHGEFKEFNVTVLYMPFGAKVNICKSRGKL